MLLSEYVAHKKSWKEHHIQVLTLLVVLEAATRRVLRKTVSLKIVPNSKENTCVRASLLIKMSLCYKVFI